MKPQPVAVPDEMREPCRACSGTGLIRVDPKYQKTCQRCHGTKAEPK